MSFYLRDSGFEVFSFENGKDALEEFKTNHVDLVLTDIMMPCLDGFSLAKQGRLLDKSVPILFMTTLDDKNSQQLGFNLGIDDYIVKPFDNELLVLKIKAILRRASILDKKEECILL